MNHHGDEDNEEIYLPIDGAGERPLLGGGDVVESSLFSNIARRLRTPLPDRPWLAIAYTVDPTNV